MEASVGVFTVLRVLSLIPMRSVIEVFVSFVVLCIFPSYLRVCLRTCGQNSRSRTEIMTKNIICRVVKMRGTFF